MAVDYAKKKPPKRKAAPKSRKRAAARPKKGAVRNQPSRSVSLPRVILTLLVVVGFAGGLTMLKKKSNAGETPLAIQQQQAQDALPELPKEEWSYIEELENKKVEVVVPERAESHPRLIQCASFRNQEDADSMRARIAFMGLEADVRATQGQTGMWYRVILGPIENQRAAQRIVHQLSRGGIHRCQIWNWTE